MMRPTQRREYREIPPLVSGYPLENLRVSFYKPLAGVNLVSNPSLETNTTGWTAVGGSISQSALSQRFGTYSLEVTPSASTTSGVYYGTVSLASGGLYFASVYGKFPAGRQFKIYFADTSGNLLGTAYEFRGTGRYQRVSVNYPETVTTSRRIYITKNGGTHLLPFYLDGLQVESDTLTSYIDGDQLGFIRNQQAYLWTGTPHASTSIRVQGTRSGGEEVFLSDYGFSVIALVGLGLGGFANLSTPNVYVGGSDFQRTVYTERTFDIAGVFQADSDAYMRSLRSALVDVLRPNAGIITQPLMLRIQALDDCGRDRGEVAEIPCSLEPSSLAGNWNNYYQDPATLTFRIYLPYVLGREGTDGAELDYKDTITGVLGFISVIEKDSNGTWSTVVNSFNDEITSIRFNTVDKRLYIAGEFTTPNTRIAAYNFATQSLESLGNPGGQVNGIAFMANGDVIAAVGAVGAGEVKRYSLVSATWTSLGVTTGGIDFVKNVAVGPDDTIYALGGFTTLNAVAAVNVAKYSGGVWTPLGAGLANTGRDAAFAPNGKVYLSANSVYQWDGTSLTTIGTTADITTKLIVDAGGSLYAVGAWTTIESISASHIAVWNGVTWSALGDGLGTTPVTAALLGDNTILVGGSFVTGGELTATGGALLWNGSAWVYYDVDADTGLSAVGIVNMAYAPGKDALYTVYDIDSTSLDVGVPNALTNDGLADTYPVFQFTGPGKVYRIQNKTTGDTLYFDLTLNTGEKATLTLGPGNISFVSTFRGNIINTIIPGSSLATFRLTPGTNSVSAFIAGTTDSNTRLIANWKVLYQSFDNSLYH